MRIESESSLKLVPTRLLKKLGKKQVAERLTSKVHLLKEVQREQMWLTVNRPNHFSCVSQSHTYSYFDLNWKEFWSAGFSGFFHF